MWRAVDATDRNTAQYPKTPYAAAGSAQQARAATEEELRPICGERARRRHSGLADLWLPTGWLWMEDGRIEGGVEAGPRAPEITPRLHRDV